MTPESWERLAAQFAKERDKSGITLKKFCDKNGINYGTAKKYISVKKVASAKGAEKHPENAKKLLKKSPRKVQKKLLAKSTDKRHLKGAYIADDFGLTEKEFAFARLVSEGVYKYQAYEQAGYSVPSLKGAYSLSSTLSRKPKVARTIHYLKEQRQERYAFEKDMAITQMVAILRADPNEISQYRRVNCRYCYGENHKYQWIDMQEQQKATATAAAKNQPAPDISGGIGFLPNIDPHPHCPRCGGEGTGKIHMADTTQLEGDARYLLEGVRLTKNGVEILTASKAETRKELLRLIGAGEGKTPEGNSALEELKIEIAKVELRRKLAEAERIERENELAARGGGGSDEPTFVINLINSPDADEEDDDLTPPDTDGESDGQ